MARLFRHKEENERSLWDRLREVALSDVGVLLRGGPDAASLERMEEVLLAADFGVPATLRLVDSVETLMRRGTARTQEDLQRAVNQEIVQILSAGRADTALRWAESSPTVILFVGVNGVGKTTSIGKMAHRMVRQGRKVLVAAGDTFRAGAIEQLGRWAARVGADFVSAEPGQDPASVAYRAVDAAQESGADVVLLDTAGRLHTQTGLMQEIEKVHRVVSRRLPGAPHEVLLVVDATTGQNALAQARAFGERLPLTGLVLSKLDSSARGGVVVALKQELDLAVKFIGTGEEIRDLVPFDIPSFADEVLAA